MPTFKDIFDESYVAELGARCAAAFVGFDAGAFERRCGERLPQLAMRERVRLISAELHRGLGGSFESSLDVLLRAVRPVPTLGLPELRGFPVWPICQYVEDYGVAHFDASMLAIERLTQLFTGETAIRPFLVQHEKRALDVLDAWCRHPSADVRRLVSEGTRPRLPWSSRLPRFQRDPTPVLALLEKLRFDSSEYVRRSVANNLNDISKDNPSQVVTTGRRWAEDGGAETQWILRRAFRTLIKGGDAQALAVLGYAAHAAVSLQSLELEADRVRLGGEVRFEVRLCSTGKSPQRLVLDYKIYHMKAHGDVRPKVFKWTRRELAPGESCKLVRAHPIRQITTRRYYSGLHRVEVLVNGVPLGDRSFHLEV